MGHSLSFPGEFWENSPFLLGEHIHSEKMSEDLEHLNS